MKKIFLLVFMVFISCTLYSKTPDSSIKAVLVSVTWNEDYSKALLKLRDAKDSFHFFYDYKHNDSYIIGTEYVIIFSLSKKKKRGQKDRMEDGHVAVFAYIKKVET